MDHFKFWTKWLQVTCMIFVLFGAALALFSQTPLFNFLLNNQVNPVFFGVSAFTAEAQRFQQWSYALLGSGCVFAGILMFCIAKNAFAAKEKWAWRAVLAGIVGWYVIDSGSSVFFHVYFNVLINTVFLTAMALPLLLTKKSFR